MQSFLLPYNPDSGQWSHQEGDNRLRDEIEKERKGEPVRWNCAKAVVQGDRGLLLWLGASKRDGPEARGIFGYAEAVSDARRGKGENENRWFACWKLKRIVNPEKEGAIIPIGELDMDGRYSVAKPKKFWHPQKTDGRTLVPQSTANTVVDEIERRR